MEGATTIRPVAKHTFLSDEWFTAVEQLFEEHGADAPGTGRRSSSTSPSPTRRSVTSASCTWAHATARVDWGRGHADDADVTLTTDYETAREVLLSGDAQAGMQAFMAGKVRLQGDFAKLMAAQGTGGPGAGNAALAEAILGVTE